MKDSSWKAWKAQHQRRLFARYLAIARRKVSVDRIPQDKSTYAAYYDATECYCEHRIPYYKRTAAWWNGGLYYLIPWITRRDLKIAAESVAICELLEQQNPELRGHRPGGMRDPLPNAVINAKRYLEV